MQRYLLYAFDSGVAGRSLVVALIVGTVLNLINQADTILAGETVQPSPLRRGHDLEQQITVTVHVTDLQHLGHRRGSERPASTGSGRTRPYGRRSGVPSATRRDFP